MRIPRRSEADHELDRTRPPGAHRRQSAGQQLYVPTFSELNFACQRLA
ncbi:hypothetical protein FB561_0323 [Kribbella amoyensis]|uniref:Uncharacterized protein n=1 Tax=Kribbella amoyensis TaxID=996641 RepID=A0A561BK62_9ACTN|nr:hypothetical protein FB561_0323 [Kribbella amoyensis]